MSGFSSEWLALREPADRLARSTNAAAFVRASLAGPSPGTGPVEERRVRALDLGCGTGANIRYLSRALTSGPHEDSASRPVRLAFDWAVVDNDPALLAVTKAELGPSVTIRQADLDALDDGWFAGVDFVTASALLDLVSEPWLERLVDACARRSRVVLFALNYDGRIEATPRDPDDDWVRDLVNAHQQTDKGLGAALGPRSGARCSALLERVGFEVRTEPSDWELDDASRELQRQLVQGWAAAAVEVVPAHASRIQAWESRRQRHVAAGHSRLRVGHVDVAGRRA